MVKVRAHRAGWALLAAGSIVAAAHTAAAQPAAPAPAEDDLDVEIAEEVEVEERVVTAAGGPPIGSVEGDIPPEIHEDPAAVLPPTLLARGRTDDWYTEEKFNKDLKYLEGKKSGVRPLVFAGGHEWTDEFREAASQFLRSLF